MVPAARAMVVAWVVGRPCQSGRRVAVGETVILLHPPLPLVGVVIWINRGCHQNDSLADGYRRASKLRC